MLMGEYAQSLQVSEISPVGVNRTRVNEVKGEYGN